MCLPVPWEFGKSYVRAAELMQIKQMFGFFFFRLLFFFLERKEEYGKAMKKIAGCIWDFREKKYREYGIRPRFKTPTHTQQRTKLNKRDSGFSGEERQARSEREATDTFDRNRRLPRWVCLVSGAPRFLYVCLRSPRECEQVKPVLQQIKERPQESEIPL